MPSMPRSVGPSSTDIFGVIHLAAALLPTLRRRLTRAVVATTSGRTLTPLAPFPPCCATKPFRHSWLESFRFWLRDTPVAVLELIPRYVQTEAGGARQAGGPHPVPLPDDIAEVMAILQDGTLPGDEIPVERAGNCGSPGGAGPAMRFSGPATSADASRGPFRPREQLREERRAPS